GAVHDVAVARDPSDVGRAPVHVLVVDVEDVAMCGGHAGEVAARGVNDPLGLPGGPARVQDVQEIFRVHGFWRTLRGLGPDEVVVPDVPALLERMIPTGPLDGHHVLDGRAPLDGLFGVLLEGDGLTSTVT